MQRKSYRINHSGSINNLRQVKEVIGAPGPGEVTVAVMAIGLNFADIFALFGLYSATPKGGFIPGLEYSGVVIGVGKGVDRYEKGDKVMGITRFGGYTSHLNIDQRYLQPLPQGWQFGEGAAYLVQALTAYYALITLGGIKLGQTVLIHSAAGGVGLQANRIAKRFGAYTIGTVGHHEKLSLLAVEGYDKGIVRGKDFDQQLEVALGQRPLDIVLECIGGKVLKTSYEAMGMQGRMVVYGSARYASPGARPNYLKLFYHYLTRPKIDPQKMIEENKSILGFNLIWLYENVNLLEEVLRGLDQMNLEKPLVGHVFGFDEMIEAINLFQSGKTMGKVVVTV